MIINNYICCSDEFCSLGEPASVDYTNQADDVTESKPPEVCSSVVLNLGSESESEIGNNLKQIPRYTSDQSDSFIVFEDSGGKESEMNLDDQNQNEDNHKTSVTENETGNKSYTNTEISENCLSAWGEETKRKRTTSTESQLISLN